MEYGDLSPLLRQADLSVRRRRVQGKRGIGTDAFVALTTCDLRIPHIQTFPGMQHDRSQHSKEYSSAPRFRALLGG